MKYGLQLYSVRDLAKQSFEEVLKQVAQMGYSMVETAGFFGHGAKDVRAMLDHYGLTVCSTHTGYRELFENFEETLDYHKSLGCKNIVLPAAPFSIKEDVDYTVACINRFQPRLEAEGISLHYHNHSGELLPNRDGQITLDELMNRTKVLFEPDIFWVYNAGYDPARLIDQYQDRIRLIHLKDGIPADPNNKASQPVGRSLGSGTAPIAAIRKKAIKMGLVIVVESEDLDPNGPAEVKRCIDYLHTLDVADNM